MIPKSEAKALLSTLQNLSVHTSLLECGTCPDRKHCGGLQIKASLMSCLDHCTCSDKSNCDVVCPRNANFVTRIREVQGFSLQNIRKREALPFPSLPDVAHLIYRSPKLAQPVPLDIVAIPFSEIYRRTGQHGILLTRAEIEKKFKLSISTKIILTGVEEDAHVEQWWGTIDRASLIQGFRDLGIICATTPNFSVIADVPRHDNMHSIKRIALSWSELHDGGIPVALHVNGRTGHDFERWAAFLQEHEEIAAIAFEFLTGAARQKRGAEYVEILLNLASRVRRPLVLIVRGGIQWIPALSNAYAKVVILNSDCTMKTRHRQKASLDAGGRVKWHSSPQPRGSTLDDLFAHNIALLDLDLKSKLVRGGPINQSNVASPPNLLLKTKLQADDEPLQMSLL